MKRRGNISLKLVADMCVKAGFNHLLTVDLHSKESQGFFSCRMDNLRAAPFFLQYVVENIPDYQNAVIIARNPLGARRATSFADRLKVNIAVLHGEYKEESDERECQEEILESINQSINLFPIQFIQCVCINCRLRTTFLVTWTQQG